MRKSSINPEEFDRLRQLYERNKSQLLEQTHQIEELKEFHLQEQRTYLLRLSNLFSTRLNLENLSLEQLRNELEEQINSFLSLHKQLTRKSSKEKSKTISNDLSAILSKYSQEFSQLFEQNQSDIPSLIPDDPIRNNLIIFLDDLYANVNKTLQEKRTIQQKFHSLESQISRENPPSSTKSSVKYFIDSPPVNFLFSWEFLIIQ